MTRLRLKEKKKHREEKSLAWPQLRPRNKQVIFSNFHRLFIELRENDWLKIRPQLSTRIHLNVKILLFIYCDYPATLMSSIEKYTSGDQCGKNLKEAQDWEVL